MAPFYRAGAPAAKAAPAAMAGILALDPAHHQAALAA